MKTSLLIAAITLVANAAQAQTVEPQWLYKPTTKEIRRYYPSEAHRLEIRGRVLLRCTVSARGAHTCRIRDEQPPGMGFGGAALLLSQTLRFTPQTEDGVAVDGGVADIPIMFDYRTGR